VKYLFLLFLLSSFVYADNSSQIALAINNTQKAFLSIPEIQQTVNRATKYLENRLYYYLPIDKPTAIILFSAGDSVRRKEINTNIVKKMNIRLPLNGKLRPDVIYNFNTNELSLFAKFSWDF
jgi:hypothetical protein